MPRELRNSVVVITGASSGIGRATARTVAEHGASVVLAAAANRAYERPPRSARLLAGERWPSRLMLATRRPCRT